MLYIYIRIQCVRITVNLLSVMMSMVILITRVAKITAVLIVRTTPPPPPCTLYNIYTPPYACTADKSLG